MKKTHQGIRIMQSTIVFLSVLLLISCEKNISFTPEITTPSIVVDGNIENGMPPRIILTTSLNYFSKITPEELTNSFVRGASVEISNGTRTHLLKEYAQPLPSGASLYYYSIDSSNLATAFVGEQGKSYRMKIVADGTEITAETAIPILNKTIDSLWWKKVDSNKDTTLVTLMSRVTDPPGFGNYIRYFTRVNNGFFLPGLASVYDDQIVDGTTYDIQVDKGVDRNTTIDLEDYAFFSRGDTVTVKFCNIDKATFDFWRTVEFSYQSIGNPFSSPTKVTSNLKGRALGYFGGYAVQYLTLEIPR